MASRSTRTPSQPHCRSGPLRDQLDIDSMDVLNFVAAIDEKLHVAVPETDYPEVATLRTCVEYVAARLA